MGYSRNPAVLETRRESLSELELGRACRWHTTKDWQTTEKEAYKLREALYIASLYPEKYPALALARDSFEIAVVEPGLIEARATKSGEPDQLRLHAGPPTPVHGLAAAGPEVPLVGLTTAAEVERSWQRHLPSLDSLNFQQTRLPPGELVTLWEWANANTPRLMLLVGEGFITVSLRDAEVEAYAWHPPQPEPQPEPRYDLE